MLTHSNLIADFAPLEHRFQKYRWYARIIGPIRVLVSVPLSHMFGQAVAIFLLPFIGVTVVLTPPRPLEVIAAARQMKAWGLITVPRLLDLLAQRVRHELRPQGWPERVRREGKRFYGWQFAARAMAAWGPTVCSAGVSCSF